MTRSEICKKYDLTVGQLNVLWQAARKYESPHYEVLNLGKVNRYAVTNKTLDLLERLGYIEDSPLVLEPETRAVLEKRSEQLIKGAFELASLDPYQTTLHETKNMEMWRAVLADLKTAEEVGATLAARCLRLTDRGTQVAWEYADIVGDYDASKEKEVLKS